MSIKPFIKWAGGKYNMLKFITPLVPHSINNYYEPFVGGGALLLYLIDNGRIKNKAYISDTNNDLYVTYLVIKDNFSSLVDELKKDKYTYNESCYYDIRKSEPDDCVESAAKFLYLNKCCFNGLYRVNSKGEFNVPFGRYSNPKIINSELLEIVSERLQDTVVLNSDFEITVKTACAGDFVYFDPPYAQVKSNSFTSYTSRGFTNVDHARLSDTFHKLKSSGVNVLMSNSTAEIVYDLYKDDTKQEVVSCRSISGHADSRKKVKELLIY